MILITELIGVHLEDNSSKWQWQIINLSKDLIFGWYILVIKLSLNGLKG